MINKKLLVVIITGLFLLLTTVCIYLAHRNTGYASENRALLIINDSVISANIELAQKSKTIDSAFDNKKKLVIVPKP